jgi:unsaturated rhamnogalacturonyl hydrolase
MPRRERALAAALLLLAVAASPALGQGPYRNRDNKDPKDLAEGTYPIPYQKPTTDEIAEVLGRVRAYVDSAAPTRVVDSSS